jgi:hypothetical protein
MGLNMPMVMPFHTDTPLCLGSDISRELCKGTQPRQGHLKRIEQVWHYEGGNINQGPFSPLELV